MEKRSFFTSPPFESVSRRVSRELTFCRHTIGPSEVPLAGAHFQAFWDVARGWVGREERGSEGDPTGAIGVVVLRAAE